MLPEPNRYSAPGTWSASPGVIPLVSNHAASQLLPLPRGIDKAAVSTPGDVAALINRFWNGLSTTRRLFRSAVCYDLPGSEIDDLDPVTVGYRT